MFDQLDLPNILKNKSSFIASAPVLIYSMSNAILLRFITHNLYRTSPFHRLTWFQIAQQQVLYTVSLYLTTFLWDRITEYLFLFTKVYTAMLADRYPPPWYLFYKGPDLSLLPTPVQFLMQPMHVFLLMTWTVALVPAIACLYCWWCKPSIPNFMFWERTHMWSHSELGRSAYYLGRPVTLPAEEGRERNIRRRTPKKTVSMAHVLTSKVSVRRTKSV